MLTVRAELFRIEESAEISGVAVRNEQALLAEKVPASLAEDGRKYSPGDSIAVFKSGDVLYASSSALFCSYTDGYEHLNPTLLFPFCKERLSSVLSLEKSENKACFGKLILDDNWYFAAELISGKVPENVISCKLFFEGINDGVNVALWAVDEDCVLLRLSGFSKELLTLRNCNARLVFNEYEGFKIPKNALHRDINGKFFVCVFSSGLVENKTVDIIYTGNDFILVTPADSENLLRQGDEIIVKEGSSMDGYS